MDHVRKLKGQKIIMTVWGLNVTACALLCDQKSYRRAFFRPPLLLIKHNVPSAAAHRWKWMWWKKNTLPLVPFQWRKSAAVPCRAPSLCFKKCCTTHHKRVVTLCEWSITLRLFFPSAEVQQLFGFSFVREARQDKQDIFKVPLMEKNPVHPAKCNNLFKLNYVNTA